MVAMSASTSEESQGERRRARRIGVWLYVFFAALYLLTSRGNVGGCDSGWRWLMAERLASGWDFSRLREGEGEEQLRLWWLGQPLVMAVSGLTARGLAAIFPRLPCEELSQALACGLHALICASIPLLIFLWARAAGYSLKACGAAGVVIGAGTLVWKYSQDCFYEPLQGVLLAGAFFAAMLALRGRPTVYMGLASLCWSGAWLVKVVNLVYAPAVIAAWLVPYLRSAEARETGRPAATVIKALVIFGLIFVPFWAAQSLFDWWRFGVWPVPMAVRDPHYARVSLGRLVPGAIFTMVGLRKGVLWYSPAWLVSLFFLPRMVRRLGWYGGVVAGAVAMGIALRG